MEKILTAVPYPVVGTAGVVRNWGPVCVDHPTLGNEPTDRARYSAVAFAEALACSHPDHHIPGTDWEFRTIDHVTGEMHMFAADGRNLSVEAGADDPGEFAPETAVRAVIVAAMLNYAYRPPRYDWQRDLPSADPAWRGWCDMTPVVTRVEPASDPFCPQDVWWVEVQYNRKGSRASFGVDRNNVPQCYQD